MRQIVHAAVLDEQREVRAAVLAPRAQPSRSPVESNGYGRAGASFTASRSLHQRNEPIQPQSVDGVFQPSMLAVGTVAVIALHGDDRFRHVHRVLRPAEADHVAGARIGLGLAMGHPHAAANHHVVADDPPRCDDRDEAQIVREHVDIVVRRQRDGDLELPRQIGAARGSARPPPPRRRPSPRPARSRARRGFAAADASEMSRASVADHAMQTAAATDRPWRSRCG